MWALTGDVTVGKELLSLFVVELRGGLLRQLTLIIELTKPLGSKTVMRLTRSATVDIERYAKLFKRLLNHRVVTIDHVLRCDAFLAGTYSNGYTMLVATANEQHILLLQAQVTYVDVGRHIHTCQMTDVNTSVGIRQRRGNGRSLKTFLFHINSLVYFACKGTKNS